MQDTLLIPAHLSGSAFRVAVIAALKTCASLTQGVTAPTETFPGLIWVDSSVTPNELYQRNGTDTGWDLISFSVVAASKVEQEAGSEVGKYVAPATQQYHPSAAKCWIVAIVSGGVPTNAASYNVASITDAGTGILTVTIAVDFTSADFCVVGTCVFDGIPPSGNPVFFVLGTTSIAAGVITAYSSIYAGNLYDPKAWNIAMMGDQ